MEKRQLNLFKLGPLFLLGFSDGGSLTCSVSCCLHLSKSGLISALGCGSLALVEEKRGWKSGLLVLLWILAIGIILVVQAFRGALQRQE